MTQPLYTEGSLSASLVIIGEAPGAAEEQSGRPFVGPAGDLLNSCLHQAGIIRQDCYITNVLKFRPQDNDCSGMYDSKKGTESLVFRQSREALLQELAACQPACIALLGETALFAVLGLSQITKRRGSVYHIQLGDRTVPVIPIIHPAAALRTYVWRNLITWDLLRAREIMQHGWTPTERTIRLAPSFTEAQEYLASCRGCERLGFDIEVVNEELSCFAVGTSPLDIMCIPLKGERGDYFAPDQELAILQSLSELLQSTTVLGQNLNFDYTFMLQKYGMHIKQLDDTMLAQAILYPDLPKGLDFITSVFTTEPYYKDEGKQWRNVEDYPKFWSYNAKDVAVCLEAFPEQLAQLEQMGNLSTYRRQRDTIQQLAYMQFRGIKMDQAGMTAAAETASKKIEELEAELQELTQLPDFNPNSPKQVQRYFYQEKGLKPYIGKSGGATTDDLALKRIARRGFREAEIILEIREHSKARGTYFTMQLDADERLRCSMNPVGTKQGRFSSSKTIFGTGGNLQNQPREMLGFMQADDGCIFISLDLEQAENRIVAVLANDEKMLNAFETGADIHSLTASYILNKPVAEISKVPGSTTIGPKKWSERDLGKRANHGLNYDMSYVKFALINEMNEKDAKFIVEKYHGIYTNVRRVFHAEVKQSILSNRTLRNPFGRTRLFLDRISDETFREGYSFIPQSTVADIINEYGLNWIEQNSGFGEAMETVEFLNNVHDSVVVQGKLVDEMLPLRIADLINSLEQELVWKGRSFRIPVGVKLGFNLRDCISLKPLGEPGNRSISPSDFWNRVATLREKADAASTH